MAIPAFVHETGYLPPGDHTATLEEVEERYGWTYRRRELLRELRSVVEGLREKGVKRVWIDGSFTTTKDRPQDVDVLYEAPPGANVSTWGGLSPTRRTALKRRARIDLWKAPAPQPVAGQPGRSRSLHDHWATDRDGVERGIIVLELDVHDQE